LGCHDRELSVLFTHDTLIAELNYHYLGRRGPTNVLAFPMCDPGDRDAASFEQVMLGDVVISVETAQREARETGETLEQTIDRLLIHGILHLLGYDHEGPEQGAVRMQGEEARLLELIREEDTYGTFSG